MNYLVCTAFLLTISASLCAAPASGPTDLARERAHQLRRNIDSFQMLLAYRGQQAQPYYRNLTLSVTPVDQLAKDSMHQKVTISKAQAEQIIEYLAGSGYLDKAFDAADPKARAAVPEAPYYAWSVSGWPKPGQEVAFTWYAPMDGNLIRQLDGLRKVMKEDEAGKAMDWLTERLEGVRKASAEAKEREKHLRDNIKAFELSLRYHGPQDKPIFHDLRLNLAELKWKPPHPLSFHATIDQKQAEKLVDCLTAGGFFEKAFDATVAEHEPPKGSTYAITAGAGNKTYQVYMPLDGALLKQLDALRACLEGDPADRMDKLIARLEGYRQSK